MVFMFILLKILKASALPVVGGIFWSSKTPAGCAAAPGGCLKLPRDTPRLLAVVRNCRGASRSDFGQPENARGVPRSHFWEPKKAPGHAAGFLGAGERQRGSPLGVARWREEQGRLQGKTLATTSGIFGYQCPCHRSPVRPRCSWSFAAYVSGSRILARTHLLANDGHFLAAKKPWSAPE